MNSPSGRAGAPRSRQYSSKPAHSSPLARRYSSRDASHPERSSAGGPPNGGGRGGDVVLDDHVGAELVEDLAQAVVHVAGALEQRLPGRNDELGELLEGGLAEHRCGLADEVLPELARLLLLLGRRSEAHQALLEPLLLERAGEQLLDDEDHAVAGPSQHVADPDAVVRRPERTLGEEDDRAHPGATALIVAGRYRPRVGRFRRK